MPSIQSDVIRAPYLRLFIPYTADRHGPAIEQRCPGVEPLQRAGPRLTRPTAEVDTAAAARVLRCIAELHAVALNGRGLADLQLRFYQHPRTGIRGVIAHIPTAGLPRGENLLLVQPAPRPEPDPDRPPLHPYVIPFWR